MDLKPKNTVELFRVKNEQEHHYFVTTFVLTKIINIFFFNY